MRLDIETYGVKILGLTLVLGVTYSGADDVHLNQELNTSNSIAYEQQQGSCQNTKHEKGYQLSEGFNKLDAEDSRELIASFKHSFGLPIELIHFTSNYSPLSVKLYRFLLQDNSGNDFNNCTFNNLCLLHDYSFFTSLSSGNKAGPSISI